jgi:hypothetical protein
VSTFDRRDFKVEAWLRWVGHWHVSAHPVFVRLFGFSLAESGRHYYFHRALAERKLIRSIVVPGRVRAFSAYAITGPAVHRYGLLTSPLTPVGLERFVARTEFSHDLAAQWYVAGQPGALDMVKQPRSPAEQGKASPDAVLLLPQRTAIEIELRQKSVSRIYRAFLAHAHAISEGSYHSVRYVFTDAALRDNYVRRFKEEAWPHFIYDASARRYRALPEPYAFPAEHPLRDRFQFLVEPLWPVTPFLHTT